MNYVFPELISNLQIISSSNARYIYLKDKSLWRNNVMLRFQFLIKIKNACYTVAFSADKLNDVKNLYLFSATIEYILSKESLNDPPSLTETIHNNTSNDS